MSILALDNEVHESVRRRGTYVNHWEVLALNTEKDNMYGLRVFCSLRTLSTLDA